MFDDQRVEVLSNAFKRLFAMPITKCTFREMNNVIQSISEGDRDKVVALTESLLTGAVGDKMSQFVNTHLFQKFIDDFSYKAVLAREVHEKGEMINLLTSDVIVQPQFMLFANRVRRVDGVEFPFHTDMDSTVQILKHFLNRILELGDAEATSKFVETHHKDLLDLKSVIDRIVM